MLTIIRVIFVGIFVQIGSSFDHEIFTVALLYYYVLTVNFVALE
jgi:hypothetical protein